jgi:hypothetical protein
MPSACALCPQIVRGQRPSRVPLDALVSSRIICCADTYKGSTVRPPAGGLTHFLHIDDFSSDELRAMLRNAAKAKTAFYNRDMSFKPFDGWTMAMIFTKPSARTRVSFETVWPASPCAVAVGF